MMFQGMGCRGLWFRSSSWESLHTVGVLDSENFEEEEGGGLVATCLLLLLF